MQLCMRIFSVTHSSTLGNCNRLITNLTQSRQSRGDGRDFFPLIALRLSGSPPLRQIRYKRHWKFVSTPTNKPATSKMHPKVQIMNLSRVIPRQFAYLQRQGGRDESGTDVDPRRDRSTGDGIGCRSSLLWSASGIFSISERWSAWAFGSQTWTIAQQREVLSNLEFGLGAQYGRSIGRSAGMFVRAGYETQV